MALHFKMSCLFLKKDLGHTRFTADACKYFTS